MYVPLKTYHFPSPHTGAAILEEVLSTLNDFGLSKDHMFAAMTDSASNMMRAFEDFTHVRCADHRIHRALTADFYKTEVGQKVLLHQCALMKIYRHLISKKELVARLARERTQELYLEILEIAEEIEKCANAEDRFVGGDEGIERATSYDPKGLKADVATRWGSVRHLFESAVGSSDIINEVLLRSGSHEYLLATGEMDEIRIIAKQSLVILDLMVLMQSTKKVTINLVVLGVVDIETTLENMRSEFTPDMRPTEIKFQIELAKNLKDCVKKQMRPFSRIEVIGALLDPEMKNIPNVRAEVPGANAPEFLLDATRDYTSTIDNGDGDVVIVAGPPPK